MQVIADLHIHSRYARGCSSQISIESLEKWARVKGLNLLGTGDFSHPKWVAELKSGLKEDGSGVLKTITGFSFILQNEVSLVYSQGGKGRRIHLLLLAPDFATVDKITGYLLSKGRVDYDGRPIFGISCEEFTKEMKNISDDIEVIPAHAWTPWFGVFGSKSGFDCLQEAFGDSARHIRAIESGLSSDPEMNRRLSSLDNINIVSFSDAHSHWPWRLGREATIFDLKELTYKALISAVRTGIGLVKTLEVDPGYGKYHFDGHRLCNVSMSPTESSKNNKTCPSCGRTLTVGVLSRIEELADDFQGRKSNAKVDCLKIIPLHELISAGLGVGINSKRAWTEYYQILKAGKSELDILLNASEQKLLEVTGQELVNFILMSRNSELEVKPGFDGQYGKVMIGGREAASSEEDAQVRSAMENRNSGFPKSGKQEHFQGRLEKYFR